MPRLLTSADRRVQESRIRLQPTIREAVDDAPCALRGGGGGGGGDQAYFGLVGFVLEYPIPSRGLWEASDAHIEPPNWQQQELLK